jgi:hypothetical protein
MTAGRRRHLLVAAGAIVVLLVALRAAAPIMLTRYLNDALADLDDYRGDVGDVDLALWCGGYTLHHLTIEKADSAIEIPLLRAPRIDLAIQWRALLNGDVVGEAAFASPRINFVQQRDETQYGDGPDWRAHLEALFPVRINHLAVDNGSLHFQNPDSKPPVDVYLSDVDLTIDNLTNIRETNAPVFTSINATATAMEHAPLSVRARLDPLQDQPQFDLDLELQELELTRLNGLLDAYLNVTAEAGTFSLSAEVAAANGSYEGYVKPLLDHAEFLRPQDFKERPLGALWETVVAAFAQIFENQPRQRIGTRVPVSGEFTPKPDIPAAIGGVFRNMFDAFLTGIEGSVELRDALEKNP